MKAKKYKAIVEEIETIVQKIEHEELDIDEVTDMIKKAAQLIQLGKKMLRQTEQDIDQIINQLDE